MMKQQSSHTSIKHYLHWVLLPAIICVMAACAQVQPGNGSRDDSANFKLTVLHTNDAHSAYGGSTKNKLPCYTGLCEEGSGGYVRLDQAARAIRNGHPNTLFLDAGDIFQGTLFWNVHKENMPQQVVNMLGYHAMAPGNHEFDAGLDTWLDFISGVNPVVVAANIEFLTKKDHPATNKIKPYTIFEINNRKIGVVGLVTTDTPTTSHPGDEIKFTDPAVALEKAVALLSKENVNIIVALTHLGFEEDKKLAKKVAGVDIVVGGHSHTYLKEHEDRQSDDTYPHVVFNDKDGHPVLVVTAASSCQYLGNLNVTFDERGVAKKWDGGPIALDKQGLEAIGAPEKDACIEKSINIFGIKIDAYMNEVVGRIRSDVEGPTLEKLVSECRNGECRTGNIITDAVAYKMSQIFIDRQHIVLLNGGSIRNSLPNGEVAYGNVLEALPFQGEFVSTTMSGRVLREVLDHGVDGYGENKGRFLQVSGICYEFNKNKEKGDRIIKMLIAVDDIGRCDYMDEDADYYVTVPMFIADGGDGFDILKSFKWEINNIGDASVVREYIKDNKEIRATINGRITNKSLNFLPD